jgi:hypothetical protein
MPLAATAAEYKAGTPFTYLFDTNSSSSNPLSPEALTAKTGWTLLAEDDLKHKFRGDAVALNDKLAVVLRSRGAGAEVYSPTSSGWKDRCGLGPLSAAGDRAVAMTSLAIRENNPASVAVTAVFKTTAGGRLALGCGITTGQKIIELRPGEATGRVLVGARIGCVVVPDLFADDMVFDVSAFPQRRDRLELPTENMFLSLLEEGDAMLMCLWRSGRQSGASMLSSQPGAEVVYIKGCEIQCVKDESLWVGLMDGPGIWHHEQLLWGAKETELHWKPPFAARWRADFVWPFGAAQSFDFVGSGQPDDALSALPQGECPCRFDAGRALVKWPAVSRAAPSASERYAPLLAVYPLDRNRVTPLTAFCPVDMLRNTLGVGPCQYILQTEGLATETNPTPEQVMSFIEKQFEKKKEKKAAEQIKDLLNQMVEHVGHAQKRIEEYADFARQIHGLCAAQRGKAANMSPLPPGEGQGEGAAQGKAENVSAAVQTIDGIAREMEQTIAAARGAAEPKQHVAKLAAEVAALIGKENSLAECQRLGAELRRIGAVQDRTLSKCRMSARWLKQQAAMIVADDAAGAELAREAQTRAEKLLQTK